MAEARQQMVIDDEQQLIKASQGMYHCVVKRFIDIAIALPAILCLFPIGLIIGAFIVLETGFPVFYRAKRGGYRNKPFTIFKFRTMVKDADRVGGGTTALNDARITKVGAVLRKSKLDELPQLINVLIGQMSFVGPRPELLRYTSQYEGLEPYILSVRPGITDYGSIAFINLDELVGDQNADEMYEQHILKPKNELRLQYVMKISLVTDAKLFFVTIGKVIQKAIHVCVDH